MSVKIMEMIDSFISRNMEKNSMLAKIAKAKMVLHGINPNKLSAEQYDDPLIIAKLEKLAKELGVS